MQTHECKEKGLPLKGYVYVESWRKSSELHKQQTYFIYIYAKIAKEKKCPSNNSKHLNSSAANGRLNYKNVGS